MRLYFPASLTAQAPATPRRTMTTMSATGFRNTETRASDRLQRQSLPRFAQMPALAELKPPRGKGPHMFETPVPARVTSMRERNPGDGVFYIRLRTDSPLDFIPGEAVMLRMPEQPGEPASTGRAANLVYAVVSAPGDAELSLCMQRTTQSGKRDLTHLTPGARVAVVGLYNQGFSEPPDDANVILIGTGTHVTPLLSLLHSRFRRFEPQPPNAPHGQTWLFAGVRQPADILYPDELNRYQNRETLGFRFVKAISRDPKAENPNARKLYVQDQLWEHRAEILPLLRDKNTRIYLCGKPSMAEGVKQTLVRMTGGRGQALIDSMTREGRWQASVF